MEIGKKNEAPENEKKSLKKILLGEAKKKKEKALRGGGKGYSPEGMENVEQNYRVVEKFLEEAEGSYEMVTEIIAAMNEQSEKEGCHFPIVGDQIDVNGKFEILAIYPPGVDVLDAIEQTPEATTSISGANFWENPFNPKQVFLPGSYILKDI